MTNATFFSLETKSLESESVLMENSSNWFKL